MLALDGGRENLLSATRPEPDLLEKTCGTPCAARRLMEEKERADVVVTKHTQLIAWQLCRDLRRLVLKHTRYGPVAREYDYRSQLRRAARSACYLTSEGFYRYRRREFANYLDWARASLGEVLDQLDEGAEAQYFKPADALAMRRLCLRAIKCNRALKRSWGDRPAPGTEDKRSGKERPPVKHLRRRTLAP